MAPENDVDAKLSSREDMGKTKVDLRQQLLAELSDEDDFMAA